MSDPDPTALRGPLLWCLLAALLFGASTPFAKLLLNDFGPFTLSGLLYLGAALAVLPLAGRGGSFATARSPRNLVLLAGAILFGGVLGPVLLLYSLQRASAASVSLWLNLETVGTALLAWLFFKEDLGPRTVAAVGLVTAGGLCLTWPFAPAAVSAVLFIAGAALCWGLDNNFSALIDGFTPAQSTIAKGAVAGSVNLALGLLIEGNPVAAAGSTWLLLAALALGGLGYGLSLLLYVRGAQHLGATRSQLVFAAAPFLGTALSWLLLSEPVLAVQLLASLLMAAGIGFMVLERHSHHHLHQAQRHTHSHRHDDGHHGHQHEGLPATYRHTHEHEHQGVEHSHPHRPDLHHRHEH